MNLLPGTMCFNYCGSVSVSVKCLNKFLASLMSKNPDHLNTHRKFFLNNHSDKVTCCESCCISYVIHIIIEVLHDLAYCSYPYQYLKKSKYRCDVALPF